MMPVFRLSPIVFVCLLGTSALAQSANEFTGTAAFLPSGDLMIEGRNVTLWGIDSLAPDQQCWHEDRAWDCGEESIMALRHHLADHPVRCAVKSDPGGGKVIAQCFSKESGKEKDVARYLVIEGWARDKADASGGLYAQDQETARQKRRGVWTSRFQTAEDWKNGVQNYVQYQMAPARTTVAAHHPDDSGNKPQ
jgi:endonuclease YncB( thermonuclease family)